MASIDIGKLNPKQLRELMHKVEGRIRDYDKERIAKAKEKVNAMLKADGLTFAQVYGGKKYGSPAAKVAPKYRNPAGPETWSGRGMRPRWFLAALKSGKKEKDMLIHA